jgi:hypothetical protein
MTQDSFTFAGFTFPRSIPRLVALDYCGADGYAPAIARKNAVKEEAKTARAAHHAEGGFYSHQMPDVVALEKRAAGMLPRFKVSTSYTSSPKPLDRKAEGFGGYLESDFMPGLRWTWADKVDGSGIDHTGWHTIEGGGTEDMRGIVMRLPRGRGFLAGWSLGEGMSFSMSRRIYADEVAAARAADQMAERDAEKEREYQEALSAGTEAAEKDQEARDIRSDILQALRDLRTARAELRDAGLATSDVMMRLCAKARREVVGMLRELKQARKERDALRREWRGNEAFAEGFRR